MFSSPSRWPVKVLQTVRPARCERRSVVGWTCEKVSGDHALGGTEPLGDATKHDVRRCSWCWWQRIGDFGQANRQGEQHVGGFEQHAEVACTDGA